MVRPEDKSMVLPWALLILAPIFVCAVSGQLIPEGVERIPTHWDFSGNVNGWGSPSDVMGLGYIMAATNVLMAVLYFRIDSLFERGLVSADSPQSARKVLVGTGVFLVVVTAIIQWVIVSSVLSNI